MGPGLIATVVIIIAVLIVISIIWGIRAHRQKILAGKEELIGKTAEVKMAMNPEGTVLIDGELWTAISADDKAKPGDKVVITRVDRLKLWVTCPDDCTTS